MLKTFYLVRHAEYAPTETFRGRLPLPLSAAGEEQARRLGQWFQDKGIKAIYSSAVLRCQQTSELMNRFLNVPIINDDRLLEDLSVMQGMPLKEYQQYADRPFTFQKELGGETPADVQRRIVNFWEEKIQSEDGNIIIVSHGDPLMFLYLALRQQGLPPTHDLVETRQEHSGEWYQDKGSIRPVVIDGDKINIQDLVKNY
jgi:2,3-bisphosphoglycerate-dependent phosphoglycerate mutase